MEEDLNKNQENQKGTWGGVRPNSGRPKGSTKRPQLRDDLTAEQKEEIINQAIAKALNGSEKLLQFFLEQIYGKARQNIGLDGGEDDKPIAILTNALRSRNSNTEDSEPQEEN